jgi:hypothetical protein
LVIFSFLFSVPFYNKIKIKMEKICNLIARVTE